MKFTTACNAVQSWKASASYKAALGAKFTEPVQGCIDDCQFIAALSAVAWASAASRAKITDPPTFNGTSYAVKKEYPVDGPSGTGNVIYARSTTAYIWPMIYEKAYAKKNGAKPIDTDPDHIDISILDKGGNPVTAIKEIMNGAATEKILANMNLNAATDSNSLYNAINLPRDGTGKTSYPSAAWTQNSGPTGIYGNHSYTLLGYYSPSQNVTYVVLRNPAPYSAGKCEEPTGADVCTSGIWNGIDFSKDKDMAFGLEISKFKQYFYSYGFVV